MRATSLLAFASLALLGACANDLDRVSLVKSTRVLAMVIDSPEIAPGQEVRARVLAFDPAGRELRYAFRACIDPRSFLGDITPDEGDPDTHLMADCTPLVPGTTDNTFVLSGVETQMRYDQLPIYAAAAHLSPEAVAELVATVGIPLQIRVHVSAVDPATGIETETLVSAVKTFALTTRAPTTNPPYVFFSIGKSTFLGGVDRSSFECALVSGERPVFTAIDAASTNKVIGRVALEPLDDPFDWEETYPYIDYARSLRIGHEGAYYSWFTTSDVNTPCMHTDCHTIREGDDTTQVSATASRSDPMALATRDTQWDLPTTPGTYHLWLVVRDGHLGEAACHTTIEVVAPAP